MTFSVYKFNCRKYDVSTIPTAHSFSLLYSRHSYTSALKPKVYRGIRQNETLWGRAVAASSQRNATADGARKGQIVRQNLQNFNCIFNISQRRIIIICRIRRVYVCNPKITARHTSFQNSYALSAEYLHKPSSIRNSLLTPLPELHC